MKFTNEGLNTVTRFTNEQIKTAKTKLSNASDRQKKAIQREEKLKAIKNVYFEKLGVNDFVCFIQAENHGIRIAYTVNPDITTEALKRDYPDNYKILLVVPLEFEKAILMQEKFSEHKSEKLSWFKPDKEIFDEIERLKQKYPHMVGD